MISDAECRAIVKTAVAVVEMGGRLSEHQLRRIGDVYHTGTTPTNDEAVVLLVEDGKLPA